MKRLWLLLFVAACPAVAWTQVPSGPGPRTGPPPYQPAVPPPSNANAYGGWPGYGGASTAAGSALSGMGSVISAAGDYNLATSAAAVNMTQAQRNEIENRQQAQSTWFEMQNANKAFQASQRSPRLTMEQYTEMARQAAPAPLASGQFDRVAGRLEWPDALQQPGFASQRAEVDQLFVKFATYGALPYADQTKAHRTIDAMANQLKAQIRTIPQDDYMVCKNFLRSVGYELSKADLQ
jgi:hypothetical protein